MCRTIIAVFIALLPVSSVSAQCSYPMLMSVYPVAAKAGTASEHTIRSRYSMEGAYEVLVSGEGVIGEVVVPAATKDERKKSPQTSLAVGFTVADDAVPGVRDVRVATPAGVSTVGQLVIVQDSLVVESDNNDTPANATKFKFPATLCGRIEKAEDVDFFGFWVEAGETLCFRVHCMGLQDRIHDLQSHADPILSVRAANGSVVATSDNAYAGDPLVCHTFVESGAYFLEIRDVRYKGNQYWCYAIEANDRPVIQTAYPLAIEVAMPDAPATQKAGAAQTPPELQLIGAGVGTDNVGRVCDWPPTRLGLQQVSLTLPEGCSQAVTLIADAGRIVTEHNAAADFEGAEDVGIPSGVNGCIESEGDVDCYVFNARKGERFTFEAFARRCGSSLDPQLSLLDAKGKRLLQNDDLRDGKRSSADARIENWSVPADGKYAVAIRDLHLRGGEAFVYFLKVESALPHFRLYADTDKTLLTPGTSSVIFVRAEKKNGFDGEIELHVEGLPDEVSAECGRILPGSHQDGCIVLTASPAAKLAVKDVRIFGVARLGPHDDDTLQSDAVIYQETYQPGGGRGHWPVAQHAVSIGTPGDILAVELSTYELSLRPGESKSIDVKLKRAEGFDKNVLLEVKHKHLNSIYGDPLPSGVTVDASASQTLLTSGATEGKITLRAAKDAVLTERQQIVVMANISLNFVMKATYTSLPVHITVEKP